MSVAQGQHAGPRAPLRRRVREFVGEAVGEMASDVVTPGAAFIVGFGLRHAWGIDHVLTIVGSVLLVTTISVLAYLGAKRARQGTSSPLDRLGILMVKAASIAAGVIGVLVAGLV